MGTAPSCESTNGALLLRRSPQLLTRIYGDSTSLPRRDRFPQKELSNFLLPLSYSGQGTRVNGLECRSVEMTKYWDNQEVRQYSGVMM